MSDDFKNSVGSFMFGILQMASGIFAISIVKYKFLPDAFFNSIFVTIGLLLIAMSIPIMVMGIHDAILIAYSVKLTFRWYKGKHLKKKKIKIKNDSIALMLMIKVEDPINRLLERARDKCSGCHKELLAAYQSFTPYIQSIYDGLAEWEDQYEQAGCTQKDTVDALKKKLPVVEDSVAWMKEQMDAVVEKYMQYTEDYNAAMKELSDKEAEGKKNSLFQELELLSRTSMDDMTTLCAKYERKKKSKKKNKETTGRKSNA